MDRRFNRVTGLVGVAIAVIALVVAVLSYRQDRASQLAQTRPDLEVVVFETTVKNGLSAEATNVASDEVSTVDGGVSGPAVTIGVLNSGEEPGLLTAIEVTVRRVWSMAGCWGAGPAVVTARYDVPLPDELFHYTNPLPLPHTVRAPADFEVSGKDVDTFTVAIGAPSSGEGSWPSLYAVDMTLIERSGTRVAAGSAVLMDQEGVSSIDTVVEHALSGGFLQQECLQRNLRLLDEVANAPGKRSPEIDRWKQLLPKAIAAVNTGNGVAGTPSRAPAGAEAVSTWIVQLQSLPRDRVSAGDVERAREDTERRLGLPVQVLNSSDYASLNPGFWVLYHAGGFSNGPEATAVCSSRGTADTDCFGRYLSHDPNDRNLICHMPSSTRPSRCERS